MRCDLCGRLLDKNKIYKWILERQGYENMIVCYECDLSIQNQIFDIIQKSLLIKFQDRNIKIIINGKFLRS